MLGRAGRRKARSSKLSDALPALICIPARNEEAVLPDLLTGLAGLAGDWGRVTVCVLLDNCADRSAALLEQRAPHLPYRLIVGTRDQGGPPNAGVARHAAMTTALDLLGGNEALLFTTDADTIPAPDWIVAGRRAAAVADAVAGRILRQGARGDALQSRIEHYYDRLHRYRRALDPVAWEARDTHHFSGGANMAIRASTYREMGGFKPLASGEDATLLDDAARDGFRVRRDAAMRVTTSSRRDGRATGGLADDLRALEAGVPPRTADPRAAAWQWSAQAAARRSFAVIDGVDERFALGERLGLTADHILGVARDCPNAEAFAMRIVPGSPSYDASMTLAEAEEMLAMMELRTCGIAA
ncbi:glycosyltransferase [Sphingomonas sp. Leaf21]|uniref:glycosyltransferase n=1 Tax=Sphingomonas sp. Leaf21 TaxID=2876550 RepID=UPI001E2B6F5F|nr:glycosyltransferase [Sphingomonas sp. Leaf21]